MTRFSLLFGILLFSVLAIAQKENNIWYFGTRAGVDFNGTTPVALTDGLMTTPEGCAAICDKNGGLLFYTDGVSVWNRNHKVMSNGKGLHGNRSSTQSAVIVKKPASETSYYIFTVSAATSTDKFLKYSEVDMSLSSGMGNVTSIKNKLITTGAQEKIAATKHQNGIDFWITSHIVPADEYRSYLFSASGVSTSVKTSAYTGGETGYLKANIDGDRMAAAHWNSSATLFNFDNSTGKLSNPMVITGFAGTTYGVEFSANGKYLYISGRDGIAQFDVSLGTKSKIIASRKNIISGVTVSAIQLASNGKLYGATTFNYLCVINEPDSNASNCDFVLKGLSLGTANSKWGLPTFTNVVLRTFFFNQLCLGDTTHFVTTLSASIDSVLWVFGDPGSGSRNYSKDTDPTHKFSASGQYEVQLILYNKGIIDTLKKIVSILPKPQLDLGNDTILCIGESITLTHVATSSSYKYEWLDESTDNSFHVTKSGPVWLKVTNGSCHITDTVWVLYDTISNPSLGNDTTLCTGDSLILSATENNAAYLWQNNATGSVFYVTTPGVYWLRQSRGNCWSSDTILVNYNPIPIVDLGSDTFLCNSDPGLQINITRENGVQYVWHDGMSDLTRMFDSAGTYYITAKNVNCITADTIHIKHFLTPTVDLGPDSQLCEGQTLRLKVTAPDAEFTWNNNSAESSIVVEDEGAYWVEVSNPCGFDSDTVVVSVKLCYCNLQIPNAFSPNFDDLNDLFKPVLECPLVEYHFSVYNRWGERIFESEKYGESWDGTYQLRNSPNGIYFYTLELVSIGKRRFSEKGTVQLIR